MGNFCASIIEFAWEEGEWVDFYIVYLGLFIVRE